MKFVLSAKLESWVEENRPKGFGGFAGPYESEFRYFDGEFAVFNPPKIRGGSNNLVQVLLPEGVVVLEVGNIKFAYLESEQISQYHFGPAGRIVEEIQTLPEIKPYEAIFRENSQKVWVFAQLGDKVLITPAMSGWILPKRVYTLADLEPTEGSDESLWDDYDSRPQK